VRDHVRDLAAKCSSREILSASWLNMVERFSAIGRIEKLDALISF
jgi:hypothetical protein